MTTPKMSLPQYEFPLPSNEKTIIRFHPFTVREQKILLMALEDTKNTEKEITAAIRQIIKTCVFEPANFNVGSLSSFDLEMLFINLRARSIGEIINLNYVCKNQSIVSEFECGNTLKIDYNVLDAAVVRDPKHTQNIKFPNSDVGIMMKYPSLDLIQSAGVGKTGVDLAFDFIASCVDFIYEGETVYPSNEMSKEEIIEFVENLTKANFSLIENFFETMPKVSKSIVKKCDKCGYEHNIEIEGLTSFFE